MKRAVGAAVVLLLAGAAGAFAFDDSREGQLVDVELMSEIPLQMHADPSVAEKVSGQTADEMLRRAGRGGEFGVLIDGRFYRFDRAGNSQARDILSRSGFKRDLRIRVSGQMIGDQVRVDAMEEF